MNPLRKLFGRETAPAAASGTMSPVLLSNAAIVRISGGLANQMLCYKLARYLGSLKESSVILDATPYVSPEADSDRNFQLLNYPIRYDLLVFSSEVMRVVKESNRIAYVDRAMVEGRSDADTARVIDFIRDHAVVYCDLWVALRLREQADADARPNGALRDLTLDHSACFDARGAECLRTIHDAAEPVAVHVRRGDFATHEGNLLLSRDYYNRSIREIESTLPGPTFFVFSDDIGWCRENIHASSTIHFVDLHDARTAYKDLYLASQCRHFILSNESTLSHQIVQLSAAHPGRIVLTSSAADLERNRP